MNRRGGLTGRSLAVAFIFSGVLLALTWSVLEPIYFTNDDVAFRLAISGEDLAGEPPTGLLLTTHAALGSAAMAVQTVWPRLPVWDLVLTVTLVAGIAGLAAVCTTALGPTRMAAVAAGLALAAVLAPLAIGLQFTISSVVCGGAAALLALSELSAGDRPRTSVLAIAFALLVAGVLVRPMGAEAGALTTTLTFALATVMSAARRRHVLRLCAATAAMIAVFALLNVADGAFYTGKGGWADFSDYHWRNVSLIEWGGAASDGQEQAVREAAGWSENDWRAMRQKWATEADRFGFQHMAAATAAASRAGAAVSPIGRLWTRGASIRFQSIRELVREVAVVATLALLIAACLGTGRAVLLTGGMLIVFVITCVCIQAAFKDLPFRVIAPLKACVMSAIIVAVADHRRTETRARLITAVVAAALVLAQQGRIAALEAIADEDHTRSIRQQVAEVLALHPSLIVLHEASFPSEHWWRPFQTPPVKLPVLKLQRNNQSPRVQHFLTSNGHSPLLRSMCQDPSILVVANQDELDVPTVYLREHEHIDVTWTQVFDGSFRVWRCGLAVDPPSHSTD